MKLSTWLRWSATILLLILTVGIILSNYSTGIYLAAGAAVTATVIGLGFLITKLGWKKSFAIMFGFVCVIMLLIPFFFFKNLNSGFLPPCAEGDKKTERELTGYSVEVDPLDFTAGSFQIKEHITYTVRESTCTETQSGRDWTIDLVEENIEEDLPSSVIYAQKHGTFLYEVIIPVEQSGFECCAEIAEVTLNNIPYHSFYDAQYAEDLKTDEYLGKETLRWKKSHPGSELRFAYIPAPFHNMRVIIDPFIQLSKYDNKILALLGFAASSIFLLIVKPEMLDLIKRKIKSGVHKEDETKKSKSPSSTKKVNRN